MEAELAELSQRLDRLENAVRTLVWWLVQAQTGFGQKDAEGIENILDGREDGLHDRG